MQTTVPCVAKYSSRSVCWLPCLGGISYAPQADDPRFDDLVQLGLTHERYWSQNVLRWGGSYTFGRGEQVAAQERRGDLHSIHMGVTATLDDSLMLGVSATFNGLRAASSEWGVTASVNYNTGPWTSGAYYQLARAEGDLTGYHYDFADEGSTAGRSGDGNIALLGVRLTL